MRELRDRGAIYDESAATRTFTDGKLAIYKAQVRRSRILRMARIPKGVRFRTYLVFRIPENQQDSVNKLNRSNDVRNRKIENAFTAGSYFTHRQLGS